MRLALLLVLLGPVIMDRDGCGHAFIDEPETCMAICQAKLGRRPFKVDILGKTGADQWRVCACYTSRAVVVDDLPAPVEQTNP
jgi:hypothetical protein